MESIAVGTVPAEQVEDLREVLIGLSGHDPVDLSTHETVLRCTVPDKPDLTLLHTTAAAGGSPPGEGAGDSWVACSYGLPLKGRGNVDLPATVRSVTRARCDGADVLAFWRGLGFLPRYQLAKLGQAFAVPLAGHEVEVTVSRVYRLPGGKEGEQPREEVVPGHLLVEARTAAAEGAHVEAAHAIGTLAKGLRAYTTLRPLPQPGRR